MMTVCQCMLNNLICTSIREYQSKYLYFYQLFFSTQIYLYLYLPKNINLGIFEFVEEEANPNMFVFKYAQHIQTDIVICIWLQNAYLLHIKDC